MEASDIFTKRYSLGKKAPPDIESKSDGKFVTKTCKCGCGKKFEARVADVKRGWGKFASKSCAAKYKDRLTSGKNRDYYGS